MSIIDKWEERVRKENLRKRGILFGNLHEKVSKREEERKCIAIQENFQRIPLRKKNL